MGIFNSREIEDKNPAVLDEGFHTEGFEPTTS